MASIVTARISTGKNALRRPALLPCLPHAAHLEILRALAPNPSANNPAPVTYPNPEGIYPTSGNTLSASITFNYQDQSSATNLQTVWALINTAIDGRGACFVAFYRPGNKLYLYPDNGDGNSATSMVL